jgi:uncharacterized protein
MKALGDLYASGHGVPQNYSMARQWFERAATAGNADAQANLRTLLSQRR